MKHTLKYSLSAIALAGALSLMPEYQGLKFTESASAQNQSNRDQQILNFRDANIRAMIDESEKKTQNKRRKG